MSNGIRRKLVTTAKVETIPPKKDIRGNIVEPEKTVTRYSTVMILEPKN